MSAKEEPCDSVYLFHSEEELADLAQQTVEMAKSMGAEESLAVTSESGGMTARASGGRLESVRRDGMQSMAITVYDAQRTGRASTQDLSPPALRKTVEQAIAIARQVQPDEFAGLPDPDWVCRVQKRVPLHEPGQFTTADLIETATSIESGALALSGQDTVRVVDAGVSSHETRWARATSQGFRAAAASSIHMRWCVAISEREQIMVRDYASSIDRRASGLMAPDAVGQEAARRSLARLGARGLSTRKAPVLFDARVATTLLADLSSALNGISQYRGQTFFPEPLEKELLAAHLSLVEDPFEPYGLASAAHDSDGVTGSARKVVEDGVVRGLFLSAFAARKLGMLPTGNADGPNNLTLVSRLAGTDDDLSSLWKRMGCGLWLTEFVGGGVDPVTGAYSKAASGFWIEDGQVSHPVHDFTVAGELPRMLKAIVAVGTDTFRDGAFRTGSILVDEMQIAGR